MDVSQLPQSIQDTLNQNDSQFAGANNGPVQPGTQMPVAPLQQQAAPAAPDMPSPVSPGSLADKISAAFLQHLANRQPLPPANSEAGQRAASVAQRVAGAAQGV